MRKSEWSNKELEDLLRQMPKLQDMHQYSDIYHRHPMKMAKAKHWFLPSIATVTVFLLFVIFAPDLLKSQHKSNVSQKRVSISTSSNQLASTNGQIIKIDETKASIGKQSQLENLKTAVYENDLGKGKVLTYWIPDSQAQLLVPVSAVIHRPGKKTWLELFTDKMPRLQEKEWGLSEYYPLHASLSLDEESNSVVVNVSGNQPYSQGSAAQTSFINAMKRDITSNSNLKKMKFATNGEPGMLLDQEGKMMEMAISFERKRAYFFYTPEGKKVPFLVPSYESYPDINSALEAMRQDRTALGLKASIAPVLTFTKATIKNKTLYLSLRGKRSLRNDAASIYSYEAILLTAKEFGVNHVKFDRVGLKNLGPFDLSKENRVPVAANLRLIEDQP